MSKQVSAIICVYNEAATIAGVILSLYNSAFIDEIIVINDGSIDNTSEKLKSLAILPKISIIEFSKNRGKGFALSVGIKKARNEILLFVDGDLKNFSHHHIGLLLQPLFEGCASMVIGQPTDTIIGHKSNPFKPLSGERALFKKDIVPILQKIQHSRFGVETLINLNYKINNLETQYVFLYGLQHPIKFQKYSIVKATGEYLKVGFQIVKTLIINHRLLVFYLILIFKRNFLNI